LRWGWLATAAAIMMWDEEYWDAIAARQLHSVREAGLLAHLPILLQSMAILQVCRGDFAAAASLTAEADSIVAATGSGFSRFSAQFLASLRGAEAEARQLNEAGTEAAQAAGQSLGIQYAQWASAVLDNSLGRYETALTSARQAAEEAPELHVSAWALPELIEAASRTGRTRLAAKALSQLAEATNTGETDWGLGIYARSRALLCAGEDAEAGYREAVSRLGRTGFRPDLARAHLLYGEWLRRERRRADARAELRAAHELFDVIGMRAFAQRARRELLATGETTRRRSAGTAEELTPQEAQIARLARTGMSNPEIAAELFLTTHTIEYHLRKVFIKLGITSRRQLRQALPADT
jgi:ATP/maltotriose-dependent transcriptional regulator MalT